MDAMSYDIGYFEGVRNALRMFAEIHQGRELEEVFELVREELKQALRLRNEHDLDEEEWD